MFCDNCAQMLIMVVPVADTHQKTHSATNKSDSEGLDMAVAEQEGKQTFKTKMLI